MKVQWSSLPSCIVICPQYITGTDACGKAFALQQPQLAYRTLCMTRTSASHRLAAEHWPPASLQEVEVSVAMLYELGEGAPEEAMKPGSGALAQLVVALMQVRCCCYWCLAACAGLPCPADGTSHHMHCVQQAALQPDAAKARTLHCTSCSMVH